MIQTTTVPFHIAYTAKDQLMQLDAVLQQNHFSYPNGFHQKCIKRLEKLHGGKAIILTGSCTAALEISALLLQIEAGDEVIMPSFAYPTMANAFVLRGARPVFVDIEPKSMNIDPAGIERAISQKTKAVVVMHYGGVACDLDAILPIAGQSGIPLIEDAAHCIGASYHGRALGTFGMTGALSFHYTKNVHCVQGGALLLNQSEHCEKARNIAEKGTDKARMMSGKQDHYSWTGLGSSYLMSGLSAAFLSAQLEELRLVNQARLERWYYYWKCLRSLGLEYRAGWFEIPAEKQHNAHLFFIKCKDKPERENLTAFLQSKGIQACFHYLPLHSSIAGKKFGTFCGKDHHTTRESERLLRLPIYPSLGLSAIEQIVDHIGIFYRHH